MTTPILAVESLSKHFVVRRSLFGKPLAQVAAVNDVSFEIAPGETLAFVGESGCGKSTLGRLVLRLIEPSAGTVRFDGADIGTLDAVSLRLARRHMQMIFQDPYAALNPRMTVMEILSEPLMLHGIVERKNQPARVAELMRLVGLKPEQAARYPHEFSGGQRQRIVIARALAVEPKLIVCDEAVSALDVSIRAQILNLLSDLQDRLGVAYLFISHDFAVVKHIAQRVAVMYLGSIVEIGEAETLFASPRHPYTQALLSAIPIADPGGAANSVKLEGDVPSALSLPSGCAFHTRCPHAAPVCMEQRPVLSPAAAGHSVACHRWHEIAAPDGAGRAEAELSPTLERLIAAFGPRAA